MRRTDQKLGRIVVGESVSRITRREEPGGGRRRVVVTVAALLAVMVVVWGSQLLAAQVKPQHVIIRGCWLTTPQQVIDALAFKGGQSYAQINRGIRELGADEVRWLRGVAMERHLPATAVLDIDERQPLLLIETLNRRYWLCDGGELVRVNPVKDTGETFVGIEQHPKVMLGYPVEEGYFELAQPVLVTAACCMDVLPGTIQTVEVTAEGEINLYDRSGFQILLGEPVDLAEKIGALPKALRLSEGDRDKLRYLDARDVDTFYEKWKEPIS